MRDEAAGGDPGTPGPSAAQWVDSRPSPPPVELREAFGGLLEGRSSSSWDLAAGGTEALRRSLTGDEGSRETAFRLLAADALLTYACEAALDEADGGGQLEARLREVVAPEQASEAGG